MAAVINTTTICEEIYENGIDTESCFKQIEEKYPHAIALQEIFYGDDYGPHRRIKLISIGNIMGKDIRFKAMPHEEQTKIIEDIEQGCYDATYKNILDAEQEVDWDNPMFSNTYNYICGNLFQNIDPDSEINSNYIIEKIFNGAVNLKKLGSMPSEDLCPDRSAEIRKKLEKQATVEFSKKTSAMTTCGRCKQKKCTFQRVHTGGLDEQTRYRATCTVCQHTWKI